MARVQKPLPGLAKFLGIETQGQINLEAGQVAVPVVEIDNYLSPNNWAFLTDAAVPANGNIAITVPEKKFWRMKWIALTVDTAAGISTNAEIILYKRRANLTVPVSPPYQTVTGANPIYQFDNSIAAGFGFRAVDLDAEPGDEIRAKLVGTTGPGNNLVRLFVEYQELDL